MSRRTFLAIGVVMALVAAAIRFNNALLFTFLRGYDGFAHFGYIWFYAKAGRIPLPDAGWEFFQPPLYYVAMATLWNALEGTDALLRLQIGTSIIALLGLVPAYVTFLIVRQSFPGNRVVQLLAPGLMLFLPVHLYSAGFIGNENLTTVLSSLSLLALWWTLQKETPGRAAVLGAVLGMTMLVKFTGFVLVATAFATIALRAVVQWRVRRSLVSLSVVAVVMLITCGWFYGRNVLLYGAPFQMSRDQLFLTQIETAQLQGRRTLLEYVLFDPLILYRPQWPRGISLDGPLPPDYEYSAMRESVPTGLYANTWFDGYGGFVLPRVTRSEASRRAGQLLLTLGMVPSILMLVGLCSALRDLRRRGWNDTIVMMLLASAAMAVVVIQYTLSVKTQSAVKASYLMPVSVAFAFWFAFGVDRMMAARPKWTRPTVAACTALAIVSATVFTQGRIFPDSKLSLTEGGGTLLNLYGVIYYAAGDVAQARTLFERAAAEEWPLAEENLGYLAQQEGRPDEALYRLRRATQIQREWLESATTKEKEQYIEATLADYANNRAILLHSLGLADAALEAATESLSLAPAHPDALFDFGVLKLVQAVSVKDSTTRAALLEQGSRALAASTDLDPNFQEAHAMRGVAQVLAGNCDGARVIRDALTPRPGKFRSYPETGPGDQNSAGILRRQRIMKLPTAVDPMNMLDACPSSGA